MNKLMVREYLNVAIKRNYLPFRFATLFRGRIKRGYPPTVVKRFEKGEKWMKREKGERVYTTSLGDVLTGHLFERENAKRLVLLFHGWRSGWKIECLYPAEELYEQGASVLIVEQRAHDRSEGKYIGFGLLERFDCLAWCNEMAYRFPQLDLYLMGFSMGASTLLLSADLPFPKTVKGIIADSGYRSPMDMVRRFAKDKLHVESDELIGEVNDLCGSEAGYRFTDKTARECLQKATLPIFFVHGTKDTMVPYSDSVQNFEDCASKKELYLLKGAGHGEAFFRDPQTYLGKITSFFAWE